MRCRTAALLLLVVTLGASCTATPIPLPIPSLGGDTIGGVKLDAPPTKAPDGGVPAWDMMLKKDLRRDLAPSPVLDLPVNGADRSTGDAGVGELRPGELGPTSDGKLGDLSATDATGDATGKGEK